MQQQNFSKDLVKAGKSDYLSKEDLLKVIRKYHRTKDESEKNNLRDVVVTNNIRLVMKAIQPFTSKTHVSPDDLFQNGVIGILIALDKFKPRKGYAFSTYAMPWVNKCIRDAIFSGEIINTKRFLSGSPDALLYRKCYLQSGGNKEKFSKLLEKHGITQEKQRKIEGVSSLSFAGSFIDIYGKVLPGEPMSFADIIEDQKASKQDDEIINRLIMEKIDKIIDNKLSEKERIVIRGLYFDDLTIAQTAENAKVSKSYVKMLEQTAIKKLIQSFRGDKKGKVSVFKESNIAPKAFPDPEEVRRIAAKLNTDSIPVSDLPLNLYEIKKNIPGAETYKVIAPTLRAAMNFLRENTYLYRDLVTTSINGHPNEMSHSEHLLRDMNKETQYRVREEMSRAKFENGNI